MSILNSIPTKPRSTIDIFTIEELYSMGYSPRSAYMNDAEIGKLIDSMLFDEVKDYDVATMDHNGDVDSKYFIAYMRLLDANNSFSYKSLCEYIGYVYSDRVTKEFIDASESKRTEIYERISGFRIMVVGE